MQNVALKRNDVLLNITGDSVARCCTVPESILPARVNQHVAIIRTREKDLDPIFLRYYLTTPMMQEFMLGMAQSGGGTRNALTKGMIEKIVVPKPRIEEQIAIVRILSVVDELIGELDELTEKKRNIKEGAMQELLTGKRRLSGYTGNWEVKNFEDVIDGFAAGQTPYRAKPEYYKGSIPWITSGELDYNVITETREKITPEAVHDTNLKIIPKGTFLFAITGLEAEGTRGSCAITGIEATTNQSCMALYPKRGLLTTNYLFHYYVEFGKRLSLTYCQGTKQQSYTAATAKLLPIILPPTPEEQSAIAQILSDMDAEIRALKKRRDKYLMIEKGMMQQLLTGRIRLR